MNDSQLHDSLDAESNEIGRLRQQNAELSRQLAQIQHGSAQERAFRLAALNLMEDAVLARRQLSAENEERRRIEMQLRDADRHKDEFLATLAHELRNPLSSLRNGLQMMKLAPEDRTAVAQVREVMERQLAHLIRLVDDLLDLSRVSQGKIELRKECVPISQIVAQAVEGCRPLVDAAGLTLDVQVPAEKIYVEVDVVRLTQAVTNLLNNSVKYTNTGGHISLLVEQKNGSVAIRVRDTGIGIPTHMLARVFDMFYQVDRSLEASRGGLGIGLSLVRRFVEMHGGSVDAQSQGPGQGSEFIIHLPIAPAPAGQLPPTPKDEPSCEPARLKVLVADDNRDAATSLAMLIRRLGHDVRMAGDGQEALEVAESYRPDLILMDIGMPRLNGYEACRLLREKPWGQSVVVVALTGWGQDEDRHRSREVGFNLHVVKPIEPNMLKRILSETRSAAN